MKTRRNKFTTKDPLLINSKKHAKDNIHNYVNGKCYNCGQKRP